MSVTASWDNETSRNAVERCSCGERVDVARSWSAFPHCSTCHKGKHYACRQCGRCLPPAGMAAFGEGRVRIDRAYCSSACRQKAYRARRATLEAVERVLTTILTDS